MATEYGVNVSNKFAFLDDEGTDPSELLARAAKEKKERAAEAKKQLKAQAAKPVLAANKENVDNKRPAAGNRGPRGPRREGQDLSDRFGERRPYNGGPPRGDAPRGEFRGPRRDGPPRRNGEYKPRPRPEGEVALDEEGKPIRRPPRRDFRDGAPRRGPRQDRVSGSEKTGVKPTAKKEGHGKGNWGDNEDELVGETEQLNVSENKENDTAEPEAEAPEAQPEEQPEEEKEPPKLTLAEWKAQQKLEKQEFKTRKANEGADQKALQKFVPLKKEEEDDDEEEVEEIITQSKRKQATKTVDIRVNFNVDRRNDRGPRNFNNNERRGPRRDGAPTGQQRFQRRGPQIDLTQDFPALGAH